MKKIVFTIMLFICFIPSKAQKGEDHSNIKYRFQLLPLELSAEWISNDENWSTKLSTGLSVNYFNIYYFDSDISNESTWSINPKIGLDFRKYFKNDAYQNFYGYYMEVSTRYFFPWTDYESYFWAAYHLGGIWPVGNNAFVSAAIGAGVYNGKDWGVGPTGTFGIGIDLN